MTLGCAEWKRPATSVSLKLTIAFKSAKDRLLEGMPFDRHQALDLLLGPTGGNRRQLLLFGLLKVFWPATNSSVSSATIIGSNVASARCEQGEHPRPQFRRKRLALPWTIPRSA